MTKFVTNQNIEINLELASLGDRIFAFIIDALVMIAYVLIVQFITRVGFSGTDRSVVFGLMMIPLMFYSLAFEVFMHGQSPGKYAREIKVVKLDGGAAGVGNYLLRWLLRPVDIVFYGAVAMLTIIISRNGQRLGDLAAGTTVIKLRDSTTISAIETLNRTKDYAVIFPQVKRLSDQQVEIIRQTLKVGNNGFNDKAIEELTAKVKEYLKVNPNMPNVKFLYTIIADYEHLV